MKPSIAIVHDWMVVSGGAERTVYELHKLYPDAPIYTSAYNADKFPEFEDADVRPTWLNKIGFFKTHQQLASIPRALAFLSLNLSEYDVVISSCSAESKYVRTGKDTLHICYCHTPIRYYWSDYDWYRQHPPFGKALNWLASNVVLPLLIGTLRHIDFRRAQKVDLYIANSVNVQKRIKKYYHRDSTVIYPPIRTDLFPLKRNVKDYYVLIGRQVAYKRLDVAVEAFNKLGYKLKVAGTGEEIEVQKQFAKPNIEFLGRVSDDERAKILSEAKGFIFPPEEDFGMVPVEAMSAGCPVIAFGKGGALEYVEEGVTGVLFHEQTGKSLAEAVKRYETMKFDEKAIRAKAAEFDTAVFMKKISDYVQKEWDKFEAR
jgi:glycosyltransferase involved in cell wall biosynthesis